MGWYGSLSFAYRQRTTANLHYYREQAGQMVNTSEHLRADTPPALRPSQYLTALWERERPKRTAVALRAHCSTSHLSEVLSGKKIPTDEMGDRILQALGGEPNDDWHALLAAARVDKKVSVEAIAFSELEISPPAPQEFANPQPRQDRRLNRKSVGGLLAITGFLVGVIGPEATPGDHVVHRASILASTCYWKVVWSTAGVYDEPTRSLPPLETRHNGDLVGPSCAIEKNLEEHETYIKVNSDVAPDGTGWVRVRAVVRL